MGPAIIVKNDVEIAGIKGDNEIIRYMSLQ